MSFEELVKIYSMRGGKGVMVILFVLLSGCLALPAQCYPDLSEATGRMSNPSGLTTSSSNTSKAGDERKITLKFCTSNRCGKFGVCYCCQNSVHCYYTRDACKAACPACNPDCPPLPLHGTTMEDQPLLRATNKDTQ
ncbi:hypothetical protein ACP70R_019027 [Stipagrostis hirtigluma subsp. patula]